MNIEQKLQVPITCVLEKMGAKITSEKNNEQWYLSPFRNEKTPSFHVNTLKNIWYDFGEGIGGNVYDLVSIHLERSGEDHQKADVSRWLRNMTFSYKPNNFNSNKLESAKEPKLKVKRSGDLKHLALIRYLEGRGIPLKIAEKHLRELLVHNFETTKQFRAIGFKNEKGGWELRNHFFKGCIAPKTITFIRGSKIKPEEINIFEGFMDYLSIVSKNEGVILEGDSIVLNSNSCLTKAFPYMHNYGYKKLFSWLDNDNSGKIADEALSLFAKSQEGMTHYAMNKKYLSHKDVNDWHMSELGLIDKKNSSTISNKL